MGVCDPNSAKLRIAGSIDSLDPCEFILFYLLFKFSYWNGAEKFLDFIIIARFDILLLYHNRNFQTRWVYQIILVNKISSIYVVIY